MLRRVNAREVNGRETAWAARLNSAALLAAIMALFAGSPAWAGETAADAGESAYSEYLSQVEDNVVLAGALDLDVLRASHQGAIRVVDLRTEGEGAPEEAAAAETLGIGYTNIPVSSAAIDAAQVGALREAGWRSAGGIGRSRPG
jgi:hypothetical protein